MLAGGVITAKASGRSQHKTERKIMNQYEKDILWAASQFLYDDLPDNYRDWSEKELHYFLEKNAWEPIEFWPADDIWEEIETLALSVNEYKKQ